MTKIPEQQYVIAIGASAGGLDAISAFFDYTPLDSVSYILIQHLSADFKSQMAQLLDRHSKLEVIEAKENVDIKPNTVYLIPSDKFMSVKEGRLVLSDKKNHSSPHRTIDYFFNSLAEERGDKSIGIILSGTGNDGSEGVQAIRNAGGVVLVQDPGTAQFSGMPLAAMATGCANLVLSPEAMPQVINDYVKDGILELLTDQHSDQISEQELGQILVLIKDKLPLDFTDYKRPTIIRRIRRRMMSLNFGTVYKYYQYLQRNEGEITSLANDFLISVTSFFRDPESFQIIEETVIPAIFAKNQSDVLKIWVAGCATGEEAYSMAILIKEYLIKYPKNIEVKIFATDINKAALDTAAKGFYPESIAKDVSEERLRQFFTREGTGYKIKQEIRKMLIFAEHDLCKNPPYCNIDLISCRNLLIYLNAVLQRKVFSLLHFGLQERGFLFLGPSENAAYIKDGFDEISGKWNILQSNRTGRTIRFDTFSSNRISELKTKALPFSRQLVEKVPLNDLAAQVDAILLKEAGFNGVCTDKNLSVVHSFGNTEAYLKSVNFKHDLCDLIPEHVCPVFKAAAHKALKLNQKVVLDNLNFEILKEKESKLIDIVLSPFVLGGSAEPLLLVLFAPSQMVTNEKTAIHLNDINDLTREHVIDLEQEVAQLKHTLEMAYEHIASSIENMQSYNEELQSANEEMHSANEEMQSTNEELQTVNKEHQLTIDELTNLNDDLNNYFRSNINGQLFVDRNLLLKRYSPAALKHINMREADIGRPLSNITTNINFETLIDDIKKVIDGGESVIREAEAADGRVYQVMTMPYLRKNSIKAEGAIVSFYDVSELKTLLRELDISNKNLDISIRKLDESNESLVRINADLNNFVFGASHDLNAPIVNIEMLLEILNDKLDMKDPEIMALSGMMNKAVINFKAILGDLAKVGYMESEDPGNTLESFPKLFEEIRETLSERIKASKAQFFTDFQVEEVQFPKKNLRSIMLNLITNALKFTAPERLPEIKVKTENREGFIILTITDNGIGVDKAVIDQIFKKYRRLNTDAEGTGVGLYLIRKIVNASGGKIEVQCAAGHGCTFEIYFKG